MPRAEESGNEYVLAVPVEVLVGRHLGTSGEQQGLQQRRPPVVLPGEWVSRSGVGQRAGNVDAQPAVHTEQAGVKSHIVGRAGRQAVARIKAFGGRAVLPRL